jgi:transposase InsO family protein
MTLAEVIYQRRVRVLEHAARTSPTEACRVFGVSRTSYYRWLDVAQRYGLDALMPKPRRRPCQPNATPPWQIEIILAEAIARPTIGARQLLEPLAERGVHLSASGVQKILVRHQLGKRAQRVAVLAQITAADAGLVTDAALDGPFGFCHFAARPGDLVALDTFYVGQLKGIGKVYQLTAIDTTTRWAVAELVVGDKTAQAAADFLDTVIERLAAVGIELTGVLTDNGPEFVGRDFTGHLTARTIDHHRTPPRSPNHNAVCERFQGTALDEFYRPAFHRQRFDRLRDLDNQLQGWLDRYNTRRRNHSEFMRGRTPLQVLRNHLKTAA